MKKTFAALTAALFVSGCEATVEWPEEGIYDCENVFDGREMSFDTAGPVSAAMDFTNAVITVEDIETGHNITMHLNQGWKCEMPSGEEWRFETEPS